MEFSIALFAELCCTSFLSIEVVLAGLTRQNLASLGYLETLRIRFVGFESHKK